jgi:hypothetical protein
MNKIKSPWYGAVWIAVWTAALLWFLLSGMFDTRESVGLTIVWGVMVGVTVYLIVKQQRSLAAKARSARKVNPPAAPSLNGPCPCGSGKKYKRCCGANQR